MKYALNSSLLDFINFIMFIGDWFNKNEDVILINNDFFQVHT